MFKQKVGHPYALVSTRLHSFLIQNSSLCIRGSHKQYPAAYRYYHNHCRVHREKPTRHEITNLQAEDKSTISVRFPLGTALVIPPQPGDKRNGHKQHWVVCLFTSRGFGGRVDSPDSIVNSTSAALQDLKRQLDELEECSRGSGEPLSGKLFSCRFNSGLFAVPWARSRELLEEVGLDVTVVYPPGDESKQ